MRFSLFACVSSLALGLALTGCSSAPPPVASPSGDQPAYAEAYPTRIATLRTGFAADEAKIQAALPELQPAADKLNSSDPATLAKLFELADEEGRSSAYANSALESETVARFWDEEKQPLHQKIGGAVSYAGKQKECSKECSDDLGGVAAGASDRAVEKQLEERQERLGEVHRFIEDHEDELGKPNLDNADKQAQAIAKLSHLVHVRLELYRRELESELNEASDVRSTLERTQKESDAVLQDEKASKNKRALAEKRKASAATARATLDGEVEQAKKALAEMEEREKKAKADYDKAFDALIDSLEEKAKNKK
jgi:hypothetical protein